LKPEVVCKTLADVEDKRAKSNLNTKVKGGCCSGASSQSAEKKPESGALDCGKKSCCSSGPCSRSPVERRTLKGCSENVGKCCSVGLCSGPCQEEKPGKMLESADNYYTGGLCSRPQTIIGSTDAHSKNDGESYSRDLCTALPKKSENSPNPQATETCCSSTSCSKAPVETKPPKVNGQRIEPCCMAESRSKSSTEEANAPTLAGGTLSQSSCCSGGSCSKKVEARETVHAPVTVGACSSDCCSKSNQASKPHENNKTYDSCTYQAEMKSSSAPFSLDSQEQKTQSKQNQCMQKCCSGA